MDTAINAANELFEALYNNDLANAKHSKMLEVLTGYMGTMMILFEDLKSSTDAETIRDIDNAHKLTNSYHQFLMSSTNITTMSKKQLNTFCKALSNNDFFDALDKTKPGNFLLGSDIKTNFELNRQMQDSKDAVLAVRFQPEIVMPGTLEDFKEKIKLFYQREVHGKFHSMKTISDYILIEFYATVGSNLDDLYKSYILSGYDGVAHKFKYLCESNKTIVDIIKRRAIEKSKKKKKKPTEEVTYSFRAVMPEFKLVAGIMLDKVHKTGHQTSSLRLAIEMALRVIEDIKF